jgi:hypothetical protein
MERSRQLRLDPVSSLADTFRHKPDISYQPQA